MREPIMNKKQMYDLLAAGRLGNTLPQYFDRDTWYRTADLARYPEWGLRSFKPGGFGAMYLSAHKVLDMMDNHDRYGVPYNVSPMLHDVTLMANICATTDGFYVHAVERPPAEVSWRTLFAESGASKHYYRLEAYNLLKRHLNENALDDVIELLQLYPDHVVEVSATSRCVGLLPHRNYVTWEVRNY